MLVAVIILPLLHRDGWYVVVEGRLANETDTGTLIWLHS